MILNRYRGKKALLVLFCTMLVMVMASGCGKKTSKELDEYKENMEAFYDKLSYYDEKINDIDSTSENAKYELLTVLDQMNEAYKAMALVSIPKEFMGISEIATEAADYMQKADEFYHLAYDGDFNEEDEQLASQYYERANSRAMVILQVLHGEVPAGEGISVTTVEPGQFSTIGASTD